MITQNITPKSTLYVTTYASSLPNTYTEKSNSNVDWTDEKAIELYEFSLKNV